MGDANVDLIQQGVDLAVRAGPLPDSTCSRARWCTKPPSLCASPAYLKRHGTPATADELKQHRWVVYPPNQRHTQIQIGGERIDIPVQGDIVTRQRRVAAGIRAGGRGYRALAGV